MYIYSCNMPYKCDSFEPHQWFPVWFAKSSPSVVKATLTVWRFNPLPMATEKRGETAESHVPYGKEGKRRLCPLLSVPCDSTLAFSARLFRICATHEAGTMALLNIYFFVWTVSLNAGDNLVNRAQWHRTRGPPPRLWLLEKVKRPRGRCFCQDF